jgi:AsmA protein
MRIFLIVLVLLIVGVVGAVLWLLRDPNAFRPEIESLIERETGLKVDLGGELTWRLWPPVQLVVHDVAADWQDPGTEPLVSARAVRLDADLTPLLGANPRLVIHGVAVEGLHARLTQSGEATNWMPPGYVGEAPPPVPIPPPTDTPTPADQWVIDAIDVRDSVIDYTEDGDAYRIDIARSSPYPASHPIVPSPWTPRSWSRTAMPRRPSKQRAR